MERTSLCSNRESKNKFNISCKISNYETCSNGLIPFFGYIEYKIILNTKGKTWEIKRRYRHFDELNMKLSKKIKNMPKLPEKTFFKSSETINNRRIRLQKYLTNLLCRNDVYDHDLIFEFIELKKEDYLLMRDCSDQDSSSSDASPLSSFSKSHSCQAMPNIWDFIKNKEQIIINENFFYSELNLKEDDYFNNKYNKNNKLITDFLTSLNSKKREITLTITNFKENFFLLNKKNTLNIKPQDLYKLYFGDRALKYYGLLYYCGDIKGNSLGAEYCVELLSNLIDIEFNLNNEIFIEILNLGKLDVFNQMNLQKHLEAGKPQLFSYCCKILKYIINTEKGITLETLLRSEVTINKVQNFFLYSEKM